jgi:hypothetical protein
VRRPAAFLSLALLALVVALAATGPAAGAKPGNRPNAKACQKGGYLALARSGSPGTAFASEPECTSYGAQGGTLVAYAPPTPTPRPLSAGCDYLSDPDRDGLSIGEGVYGVFNAGERVTVSAAAPSSVGLPTTVQLYVNSTLTQETAFPGTLTYDVSADGFSTVSWKVAPGANVTWTVGCGHAA